MVWVLLGSSAGWITIQTYYVITLNIPNTEKLFMSCMPVFDNSTSQRFSVNDNGKSLYFPLSRGSQHVPLKCLCITRILHGTITHKTTLQIHTTVKTSKHDIILKLFILELVQCCNRNKFTFSVHEWNSNIKIIC